MEYVKEVFAQYNRQCIRVYQAYNEVIEILSQEVPQQPDFIDNVQNSSNTIPLQKINIENLNEKYFKIKETLSRCGNFVSEINKKETIDILYSFFNCRKKQKN